MFTELRVFSALSSMTAVLAQTLALTTAAGMCGGLLLDDVAGIGKKGMAAEFVSRQAAGHRSALSGTFSA